MSKLDRVQSCAEGKNGRQQATAVCSALGYIKLVAVLTFSSWKHIIERKINERFHLNVLGSSYPVCMD